MIFTELEKRISFRKFVWVYECAWVCISSMHTRDSGKMGIPGKKCEVYFTLQYTYAVIIKNIYEYLI